MAENEEPKSSLYYMDNIECRLDSIETPALVALYRPLISRCVKVDDVVFYLDDVINTGNMSFLFEVRLRISWELFKKSVKCNENLIFDLSPNLRKKLKENKIIYFHKNFKFVLIFILNRKTRGNHCDKGKERFNEGYESSLIFHWQKRSKW